MKQPFLIIGAAKSATTSIYHYLKQHEAIFMPPERTILEFLDYDTPDTEAFRESYFKGHGDESVMGTKIAAGLCFSSIAPRLHAQFPEAKLIVSLRNPIERTYSHWWMRYEKGSEPLPFYDAMSRNFDRLKQGRQITIENLRDPELEDWPYLEQGHYAKHLKDYLEYFPRERLKVVLFDDFKNDPVGTIQGIFRFVGVDPEMPIRQEPPRMAGMGPMGRILHRAGRLSGLIHLTTPELRARIRRLFVSLQDKRPNIAPDVRSELLAHFRPHNEELQELLGRDLSHWNR